VIATVLAPQLSEVSIAPQTSPGRITGAVGYSAAGKFFPAASRTVHLAELQRKQISDARGEFRFENVPPGTYSLTVLVQGQPLSFRVEMKGADAEALIIIP
jgi:hypothetical protein